MKAGCPPGEVVGNKMIAEGKIPVISCEGECFRGEISRIASHPAAKEALYSRGCHGEMFTAPRSAMAEWAKKANEVVVIDGCLMHCHGRFMKNIVGREFNSTPSTCITRTTNTQAQCLSTRSLKLKGKI